MTERPCSVCADGWRRVMQDLHYRGHRALVAKETERAQRTRALERDLRAKLAEERRYERLVLGAADERARHVAHASIVGAECVEQRLNFFASERGAPQTAHELMHVGANSDVR